MEPHPNPNPPPSPAGPAAPADPAPGAAPTIRAHWTPAKQRIFLAALLESGGVARAARAAGMSRSSAHRLRRRLAGTPFVRDWDRMLALHARRLADPLAADAVRVAAAARTGADRPPAAASPAHR